MILIPNEVCIYLKNICTRFGIIFLFGIILLLPQFAAAQIDKEFWFAAPHVYDAVRDFNKPITLRITTLTAAATVVISIPADPSFTPISRNIGANSTVSIDLTSWVAQLENIPANTTLNKGLLIKSTADITAYYEVVSSFCNCNPEIFSLKGKNALGDEFFISSQYTYDESTAYTGATNSFDIVATENNTRITITPSKDIVGHKANIPFVIVLNRGQTYSAVASSKSAGGHLQGSYVSSDNPIAVTIKDDLVQISSCADLIGDQTIPVDALGKEYIVTKGFLQPVDKVYVLAVANGSSIFIDGSATPVATLAKGESITLDLSNPSTYIRSDNKIYVYHLTGNGCEAGSAIIPQLNCVSSRSINIVRSSGTLFAVLITTKNGNQNSFTVNGNNTLIKNSDFFAVPGTGGAYVTSRIDLSSAVSVGTALNFANSSGSFSLGFINGGTNDGTRYGFFSDYRSTNVENSSIEICPSASVQLSAFGGVSYRWSPSTGLSNPNISNPMASPGITTEYTVAITTSDGCVDSARVRVKVLGQIKVDTTATLCPGGTYKLPSGKVVNTAGIYTDIVSYKSGCDSLITTLDLKISGTAPSLTIASSANNICAGTLVTFTASPINEGTSPTYQWQLNGTNIGSNSLTFSSAALANNDKISCIITSGGCVVSSNSITMNVSSINGSPSLSISASQNNICAGSLVTLTASPVNGGSSPTYQWFVNGVKAGTNSSTFSSSSFVNGDNITCEMTTSGLCTGSGPVTSNGLIIVVNSSLAPSVNIVASANNICPGTMVTFTATAINSGTAPSYQWQVNGNNSGNNNAVFTSNTLKSGDVVKCLIVSSNCSNTATSNSISININPAIIPSVSIVASQNNICLGTSVTFTATPINGGNAPIYQWFINGNSTGVNSNKFTSSNLSDKDVVSCQLSSDEPCASPAISTSNSINMIINPAPVIDVGGDKTIKRGNSIQINATTLSNIANVTWSPNTGLDNANTLSPNASPDSTTTYTITLLTTEGCVATATVKILVLNDISVPNTFTPNGDGINDNWKIKNLTDYPNCTIKVFNRWGEEVYRSIGYQEAWNGTSKGKILPSGTIYYYLIYLNDGSQPLSGYVAIIK